MRQVRRGKKENRLLLLRARGDLNLKKHTAVPLSFLTQRAGNGAAGDITPTLPGALHLAPPQDGFQPVTVPLWSACTELLFPFIALTLKYITILAKLCQPQSLSKKRAFSLQV